jgi:hypothetical protein
MNWKEEIVKLVMIKQALAELDKQRVWPHHLPSVAASPESIADAERHLGFALDTHYAEFLRHANGWKGFYQTVDLFGVEDLMGSAKMQHALELLEVMGDAVKASGFNAQDFLPLGVTLLDRDLFVLTKPTSARGGLVIWFSGEEADRFQTFEEFFLAMMDYNREEVAFFKDGKPT